MNYRIERRVPFGFAGLWGKLYKKYIYEGATGDSVEWQDASYVDIGQDVQFKLAEKRADLQRFPDQPVENMVVKGDYRVVKTTDSCYNDKTHEFDCICDLGDIVFLMGEWWVVDSLDSQNIYSPRRQTFYFVALKRISKGVIRREENA